MRKWSSQTLSFLEDEVGIPDQEHPCAQDHYNLAKQLGYASISIPYKNDNEAEGYKEIPNNKRMGYNTRFIANLGEIARNAGECTM